MSVHGWVTPNPDGSKARCGGPALCGACAREKAAAEATIAATLNDASSGKQQGGGGPAETVRRAAALMRERAGGCEPRRWHWEALGDRGYPQRVTSDGNVTLIAETFIDPAHRPYEAEHIASWSPPVALAVAGWLDSRADDAESATPANGSWDLTWCDDPAGIESALKIARVYLGEPA